MDKLPDTFLSPRTSKSLNIRGINLSALHTSIQRAALELNGCQKRKRIFGDCLLLDQTPELYHCTKHIAVKYGYIWQEFERTSYNTSQHITTSVATTSQSFDDIERKAGPETTRLCEHGQKHGKSPGRFRFTLQMTISTSTIQYTSMLCISTDNQS